MRPDGHFSDLGHIALAQAGSYHYPVTYLPTLARVDELLFGDPLALRARTADDEEVHVDRRRDILFSGLVYEHSVGPVVWDRLRSYLQRADRPHYLIDLGCGDGRMLAALGRQCPGLRLIGMEYNLVARNVATATLAEFPGALVVEGDIGNPAALVARLGALGIETAEALFITKSVIHNRRWSPPKRPVEAGRACGAAATQDGQPIDGSALAQNLLEFFETWRPFVSRHGFFIIEPHCVTAGVARRNLGRTISPCLEYTHCLSGQLLVDAALFRGCAALAGYRSDYAAEIGATAMGHDHMTVDHFMI
jgi:hypothetical protein